MCCRENERCGGVRVCHERFDGRVGPLGAGQDIGLSEGLLEMLLRGWNGSR